MSTVWKWFGFPKMDEEQIKPLCKICRQLVPNRTINTSYLFHHLNRYHPSYHTKGMKMQAYYGPTPHTQPTNRRPISSAVISTSDCDVVLSKQQTIVPSFAAIWKASKMLFFHCMAKDNMSLSTVEKDGFRKLIKVLTVGGKKTLLLFSFTSSGPCCSLAYGKAFHTMWIIFLYENLKESLMLNIGKEYSLLY